MAREKDKAPEVGKTATLDSGAEMTLIGYEEEEDGDFTLTWTLKPGVQQQHSRD